MEHGTDMKNLITVILFALLACLPAEAGFVPNAYDQTNTAGVDARSCGA